jgi:hypothetical protein
MQLLPNLAFPPCSAEQLQVLPDGQSESVRHSSRLHLPSLHQLEPAFAQSESAVQAVLAGGTAAAVAGHATGCGRPTDVERGL